MNEFIHTCNRLSLLDETAIFQLEQCLKYRDVRKGQVLLSAGSVCQHLYFVNTGLAKTSFTTGGKEFIMRFFREKEMFTVIDSFVTQRPSTYAITMLEPGSLTYIEHNALEKLCREHHCIDIFYRRLLAIASVNMMKRISEMLEENGAQRYRHFLEDNGDLPQCISLGDLASYLGITQVSLSRIRAQQ
jgi:CRP-like cAMP-binding protein